MTPIQKAISFAKDTYTPTIAEPMVRYLESLLDEERKFGEGIIEEIIMYEIGTPNKICHHPLPLSELYIQLTTPDKI